MLPIGENFPKFSPVVYWAQSVNEVLVNIKLHKEMDTPLCKQSFDRTVVIDKDMIRVSAYCMQYNKDPNIGVKKKNEDTKEKAFDLDRKRDDESIIDVQSLKDPDYQINKKAITLFDSDEIEMLYDVDFSKAKYKWEGEGEVHLIMPKSTSNKVKYWKQLEKNPNK